MSPFLGEFEQRVLMAILRLGAGAYGVTIMEEIERRTGRRVSLGAVYTTLARLEKKGYVLLTGDVSHFHENYERDGVPAWNANRADSLASLDRFKEIAGNLDATVIIQHDPRDIAKLPVYPAFAE